MIRMAGRTSSRGNSQMTSWGHWDLAADRLESANAFLKDVRIQTLEKASPSIYAAQTHFPVCYFRNKPSSLLRTQEMLCEALAKVYRLMYVRGGKKGCFQEHSFSSSTLNGVTYIPVAKIMWARIPPILYPLPSYNRV